MYVHMYCLRICDCRELVLLLLVPYTLGNELNQPDLLVDDAEHTGILSPIVTQLILVVACRSIGDQNQIRSAGQANSPKHALSISIS
jgi:hypothetical protein